MTKTCAQLFEGFEHTVIGNADEEVGALRFNSRDVQPGDAYFCIVGTSVDGHIFAQDAIDRGARVLVVQRVPHLADSTDVTEVVVGNTRKALAYASTQFYDNPSRALDLVGVTGTNGKTTTTYLVKHISEHAGHRAGSIGTVGVSLGDGFEKSALTTPDAPDMQRLLADMRDARCDIVALEVSSQALDMLRPWNTRFAVTAFTNLTQDHLDYHHTFEAYFEAKALLFGPDYPAKRVVCIDDKWGRKLHARCSEAGDSVITTGFAADALIHPVSVDYGTAATELELEACGRTYKFSYPLVGKFNVENVMTAFGICLQLGIPADSIVGALRSMTSVPGRLERVKTEHDGDISVFVDYAHTPDALEKALSAIKAVAKGRIIVVFGCGGNRDSAKRPLMGAAAQAADYAVVTSDNPRNEDPALIIEDILAGMSEQAGPFEVVPDRRAAIARAIAVAQPGDSILVAGKGHEDYQLVGGEVLSFDDRKVAAEELEATFGKAGE